VITYKPLKTNSASQKNRLASTRARAVGIHPPSRKKKAVRKESSKEDNPTMQTVVHTAYCTCQADQPNCFVGPCIVALWDSKCLCKPYVRVQTARNPVMAPCSSGTPCNHKDSWPESATHSKDMGEARTQATQA
jgi:hypothetical protein